MAVMEKCSGRKEKKIVGREILDMRLVFLQINKWFFDTLQMDCSTVDIYNDKIFFICRINILQNGKV